LAGLAGPFRRLHLENLPRFEDSLLLARLAEHGHLSQLQSLSLAGCNNLTDSCCAFLTLHLPELRSLCLAHCYILTDATLDGIGRCAAADAHPSSPPHSGMVRVQHKGASNCGTWT
jgi:hypothetical protein